MCRKCNFFYADAVSGEEQLGVPGHVFLLKFPESTPDAKYCSLQEYPRLDLALGCAVGGCWALPVFILFRHTCQRFSSLLLGMENLSSTSCMLFFRFVNNPPIQAVLWIVIHLCWGTWLSYGMKKLLKHNTKNSCISYEHEPRSFL